MLSLIYAHHSYTLFFIINYINIAESFPEFYLTTGTCSLTIGVFMERAQRRTKITIDHLHL